VCHGNSVLGNMSIDVCVLKNELNLTMNFFNGGFSLINLHLSVTVYAALHDS